MSSLANATGNGVIVPTSRRSGLSAVVDQSRSFTSSSVNVRSSRKLPIERVKADDQQRAYNRSCIGSLSGPDDWAMRGLIRDG